ncbi:hypothetical protein GQ457_05G014180 [Hibiscus cannabinus]
MDISIPIKSHNVRWKYPDDGWSKVNSNGARCQGDRRTACGRVVRNSKGEWILGFFKFISIYLIVEAEIWSVIDGLQHAWMIRLCHVWIELDNANVRNNLKPPIPFWSFHPPITPPLFFSFLFFFFFYSHRDFVIANWLHRKSDHFNFHYTRRSFIEWCFCDEIF